MMRVKLYVFSSIGLLGVVLGTSGACFDNDSCLEDGSCYSGTGSNPAKVEICGNEFDDDGDDKFDCADEDCANEVRCEDWPDESVTYFRIRVVENSAGTIACVGGDQPTSFFKGDKEAQCEACTCAGSCDLPKMQCEVTSGISFPKSYIPVYLTEDETCQHGNGNAYYNSSCAIDLPNSWRPQCSPVGGGRLPPGKLDKRIDACLARANSNAGCTDTQSCVEKNDDDGDLCVMYKGTLPDGCPSNWPNPHTAYKSQRDTRACKCNCPEGSCEGGGYIVYENDKCAPSGYDKAVVVGTAVNTRYLLNDGKFSFGKIPPIANCTANPGTEGSFDDSTLATFCCKPGAN